MNDRAEVVNNIVYKMNNILDEENLNALKNIATIVLEDYDVTRRETQLTTYNGDELNFFVKKFLITKKVEGCTDRTLKYYKAEITKILKTINKSIKDITGDDILLYIANRDIRDHVAKTTQDNELRCLRTFFTFLLKEDYIQKNPCLKVKAIRAPKIKKKAFTEYEIEKIRNACKNNKEKAMIETMLSTGCRASEIMQIKYENIKDGKMNIIGKGQKERTVYFNAKAQIAIENYLSERKDSNPYLFPKMLSLVGAAEIRHIIDYKDPDCILDGPGKGDYPNMLVKKIAKRAGIKGVHAHKFRRTCATLALRRGMPLEQVSKMLGHVKLDTTKIYLDITDEEVSQSHKKYMG